MSANEKRIIRTVVLGDYGVGKSSLILRAAENIYIGESISTRPELGLDDYFRMVNNKDASYKIYDINDGAIGGVGKSKFAAPHVIIACFDPTNRDSFENIKEAIKKMPMAHSRARPRVVLVGNKCDNDDKRVVSIEEAQQLVQESYLTFYAETSAKENINCTELFDNISNSLQSDKGQDLLYQKSVEDKREMDIQREGNQPAVAQIKKPFNMGDFKEELKAIRKNSKREFFFGKSNIVERIFSSQNSPTPKEILEYAKYRPLGTVKEALDKFDTSEIEAQQKVSFSKS